MEEVQEGIEQVDESVELSEEPEEDWLNRPRFDIIESFFLIAFNALGDIAELLDITGVGVVVGLAVDFINGPLTVMYLWIKGVPRTVGKNALAQTVELFPFIDILPIRTVAIVYTILITNHPERFRKLQSALSFAKKVKK